MELDPASIRKQIGIVSADGSLFNETIGVNIAYKNPLTDKEEIEKTILAAGLEHTVKRLPLQLETMVGENGIGLSVGERQRSSDRQDSAGETEDFNSG